MKRGSTAIRSTRGTGKTLKKLAQNCIFPLTCFIYFDHVGLMGGRAEVREGSNYGYNFGLFFAVLRLCNVFVVLTQ
jgi:hypothetical protein